MIVTDSLFVVRLWFISGGLTTGYEVCIMYRKVRIFEGKTWRMCLLSPTILNKKWQIGPGYLPCVVASCMVLIAGCPSPKTGPVRPTISERTYLIPFLKDKQWGYVDTTGAVMIPARFDLTTPFSEGRAAVRKEGQWGYVNPTGREVIRARYSQARAFADGMAAVMVEGKFGYIDTDGKMRIAPRYSKKLGDFSEGLAAVPNDSGKWGFIDRAGKPVIPPQFDKAGSFANGRAPVRVGNAYGFIDHSGKVITPLDFVYADRYASGLALVRAGAPPNVHWAFVDSTGRVRFTLQADETFAMAEGLSRTRIGQKWGYVNTEGQLAIPVEYDFASDFSEGLAPVRKGGGWGYVSPVGEMAVAPQYLIAEPFRNGLGRVTFKGGWGYINKSGKLVWQTSEMVMRREGEKKEEGEEDE